MSDVCDISGSFTILPRVHVRLDTCGDSTKIYRRSRKYDDANLRNVDSRCGSLSLRTFTGRFHVDHNCSMEMANETVCRVVSPSDCIQHKCSTKRSTFLCCYLGLIGAPRHLISLEIISECIQRLHSSQYLIAAYTTHNVRPRPALPGSSSLHPQLPRSVHSRRRQTKGPYRQTCASSLF